MARPTPLVEPGQRWALRDDRYDGWRYLTVTAVGDTHVQYAGGRRPRPIARNRFGRGAKWTFCGHDGPGVLPPYSREHEKSVILGCYPFGRYATTLPLESFIEPGFGWVEVTRDGETVFQTCRETRKRLAHFELKARETPGDWRIRIESPLSERLYQRQPDGWVLVAIGMGFA